MMMDVVGGGVEREEGFVRGCWARWRVVVVWTFCSRLLVENEDVLGKMRGAV